jgi:TonB family protein
LKACFQDALMFGELNPVNVRRQRWVRWGSLAAHALVLAWLLHAPEPMLLNPISATHGQNGHSITRLYWPSKSTDDSTHSSSDQATERYRHQHLGSEKLTWKAPPVVAKATPQNPRAPVQSTDASKTQTLSALGHGVQAGLSYGTLNRGQLYGEEVRPALPIVTSDPVVYPWQLPEREGNVVVEITIDEQGAIVNKTVLQSLGADLDQKFLAALDHWRFHPATRNGSPIPSKQDAVYTFRARG